MTECNNIYNPIITRKLEISTIHITEQDDKILTKLKDSSNDMIFIANDYGYEIFVPISLDQQLKDLKCIEEAGLSKSFTKIFEIAIKARVNSISIDRDGPIYDNLAKFDW